MILRDYMPSDCREMAELFFDTVHTVNRGDYSEEQVNAWADGSPDLEKWNRSFLAHTTVVAEEDGRIVGFGDIDPDGYLDRLYVRSDKQRKGIASAVCERLENAVGAAVITTHASITARGFLKKRIRHRQRAKGAAPWRFTHKLCDDARPTRPQRRRRKHDE